jgi:predicted dehydrogenase
MQFTDFNELLKMPDLDVVSIGLPVFACICLVAALRAGKHVLCENPGLFSF